MPQPIQKILFGSPGTGKSYKVEYQILPSLDIDVESNDSVNCIKAVFHPEYTYGDFMGKLLPITRDNKVEYNYYEGHFLRALAQAYKNILDKPDNPKHVALVIDEINRGNSSAIFGMIFQLLDRKTDGWSSYEINISKMEFERLIELMEVKTVYTGPSHTFSHYEFNNKRFNDLNEVIPKLKNRQIRIPFNMSIVATMNTSDSSIYYMDTAFKRRWDWEFVSVNEDSEFVDSDAFLNRDEWKAFVKKLNSFIRKNNRFIRSIEDKQIGQWFITDEVIKRSQIRNKLMFFLWDSVFNRDKKPLAELLKKDELIVFGDFADSVDDFIKAINNDKTLVS